MIRTNSKGFILALGFLLASGCATSSTYLRNYYNGPSELLVPGPYRLESATVEGIEANFPEHQSMRHYALTYAHALETQLRLRGITVLPAGSPAKSRILVEPTKIAVQNETPTGAGYVEITIFDNATGKAVGRYTRVMALGNCRELAEILVTHCIDAQGNLVVWDAGKLERWRAGFEGEKP